MTSRLSKPTKALFTAALALLVSACASHGPTDNPVVRKFSWFSYLEGGDFRDACAPGAADRYRLVYNGVYTEQVRTYDIGPGNAFEVHVIGPANLRRFYIDELSGLLNPWRGETYTSILAGGSVAALVTALEEDGVFGPPAVGLALPSNGFFWTVAACHEGAYRFTGLAWPSPAWDRARFDDAVFNLDPSTIPVNPPRKTDTLAVYDPDAGERGIYGFNARVGENGLWGTSVLFR